jgi:hypothetical protein
MGGASRFFLGVTGGILASATIYSVFRSNLQRDTYFVDSRLKTMKRDLELHSLPAHIRAQLVINSIC